MFFTDQTQNIKPMSKSQIDKMLHELEKEIFGNQWQEEHQLPFKTAV